MAEVSNDTICMGDNVSLYADVTGGSGSYTYLWTPEELFDNPNAQTAVATPTELGENVFTVAVNDGENVKVASVSVYVINCESINEKVYDDVMIYPNPANDIINVLLNVEGEKINWTLSNINGQVVKKSDEYATVFEIKLDDVNNGLYFLNINVDGKQMMKKIVVE